MQPPPQTYTTSPASIHEAMRLVGLYLQRVEDHERQRVTESQEVYIFHRAEDGRWWAI